MSDLSSALDNFYSNFVLRDILSFIFPGAIVCISLSIWINPDDNRILFISNILPIILLFGVFYLVGFSIQIIREGLERSIKKGSILSKLPDTINGFYNREDGEFSNDDDNNVRYTHTQLLKTYKEIGHYNDRPDQILERFTAFYQFFGNSCLAFTVVIICFLIQIFSNPQCPIPIWVWLILLVLVASSYIGYVIHKRRRKIWMSVILDNKYDPRP
jgi:hypothetical protein